MNPQYNAVGHKYIFGALVSYSLPFMKFKAVKLAQFLAAGYILVVTFTKFGQLGKFGGAIDPETGFIIDVASEENTYNGVVMWNGQLRSVVARTTPQMILLGISRFSGFFMYPALILVYLTKLRATGAYLSSTMFNMFLYQDMHRLHTYCGWVILLDSCVHTICHLTRWFLQGNLTLLLVTHVSGITGFVIVASTALICMPMLVWKQRIKYEIRKLLHYFFLVFGLALCFHAPKSAIPNGGFCAYIFPTLLLWYSLDTLYCCLFMTELIETAIYQTLPSGVQLTMAVSKRFQNHRAAGGYCYICFPWVDRSQWHAFSLFENPGAPEERQVFMQKNGDWTSKVHELLQRSSVRPVLIQGPFPSPYKNAIKYDNQILVASGIGITPALSVIRAHKDYRRLNLVWAVRDPHMLQFFLEHAYLDNRGWNLIFYTGKEALPSYVTCLVESLAANNVHIIHSRPNLKIILPQLIYSFEVDKDGDDDKYFPRKKTLALLSLKKKLLRLDASKKNRTSNQKVTALAAHAEKLGYTIFDLIHHLEELESHNRVRRRVDSVSTTTTDIESGCGSYSDPAQSPGTPGDDSSNKRVFSSFDGTLSEDVLLIKLKRFVADDTVSKSSGKGHVEERHGSAMQKQWSGIAGVHGGTEPWVDELSKSVHSFVRGLDEQTVKSTWGVLYCGGKNPLLTSLKEVATDIGIKLHEESFNW